MIKRKEDLSWLIYISEEKSPPRSVLKKRKEAFLKESGEMIFELTLLLGSGLVLSKAFEELISRFECEETPLRVKMRELWERSKGTNSSFTAELQQLAALSADRDFIRFAFLLAQHAKSGSELSSRLEKEQESLLTGRLARAKAMAREAETKLCLPLALLLISIIMISASPAIMELGM